MNAPRILVAGASGYIGQALIPQLLKRFPEASITALSRSNQDSDDARVTWRACDLFSLKSLEAAMPESLDLAFYLVHSMGPTAQMDQGSFADYDLILADNFARILKKTGVKQLIYLGGLIPNTTHLSLHLQSRLEVEETFSEAQLPVTTFRAGLIIGDAGSSFQILSKLVSRLPVMLCPKWTQTLTTPVDLQTVIASLIDVSLNDETVGQVFDLAGCEPLTYVQMMRDTAQRMGKTRLFFAVPFFTPTLSRLWVSLITGSSRSLVYPLVASLEHPMVARHDHLFRPPAPGRTYLSLLSNLTLKVQPPRKKAAYEARRKTVRSVQRLPLPLGKDAEWVKDQYVTWLPRFLAPLIQVIVRDNRVSFSLFISKEVMLDLFINRERSNPDRQLLYIKGGQLVSPDDKGRLEFRVVLHRRFVLAAIHDFRPSLPWFLYRYTQALIHLWVMSSFAKYLKSASTRGPRSPLHGG